MNPSRMRKTVGGIALSFVLAVVLGISGVIAPGGGAALGASTTLTILGGEVQVSRNGGAFEPAADGAIIGPGDVIRTGADSRAVLTYFEGSTVSVEPSSELAIDEASSNPDGSTVVVMSQNLGRTWHVVTKLITGGSKYEVRTPAATASVRGTEFAVGVARDASGNSVTDIATTGGAVAVAAPATAADPQPEPVVVPAGFRTSATSGERKAQAPTIVPEPERKVTVTIGSANALVVDPLGRSNGYKDGKLVLQTPGAQVVRTAGTLLITLPDVPDGKISTVVARATDAAASSADVPVITNVQERGKSSTLVQDTVKPTEIVTGLEVKASGAGPEATPEVRRVTEDEKKDLNTGKVVEAPKVEARRVVARPGLGGDPSVIARIAEERRGEPAGGATGGPAPEPRKAAQAPAVAPAPAAPAPEESRGSSFVQPLPFQGAPSAANQQREEAKQQDASNRIEAEIKGSEQLQKAAETATKVAESAKIVAESGQQRASEDKARHEQQLKAAEEAAREAQRKLLEATDAAKKKEAEEAARQAEAQKQASEAARRRAEIEAKQKADEAIRADAARKAAAEVAERARLEGERLRQQQQQQQGGGSSGGGNSGGGSSGGGSSNDGKKGSGKSEEAAPAVKLPELPRLPGSQKP